MRETVGGDTPNIRAICAAVFRPEMTASAISRRLVSSSFLRRPLLDQGYTYPTIGPSPEGYTGYAMRHGAKIKVTIGKHGAVTPEPD